LRHRAHRRRQPDDLQPRLVALSQNQKRAGALSSSLTVSGDLWAKRLLSHLRRVECYPNGGYWINEGGRVRPSGGRHVDASFGLGGRRRVPSNGPAATFSTGSLMPGTQQQCR
jgi:hypothetical protein